MILLDRAELDKGNMFHADSFNLADSMSALEMMDPKMDAGLVTDENRSVVPAGLCQGYLPQRCCSRSRCCSCPYSECYPGSRNATKKSCACCRFFCGTDECFERGLVDLNPDRLTTLLIMDKLLALESTWLRCEHAFVECMCMNPASLAHLLRPLLVWFHTSLLVHEQGPCNGADDFHVLVLSAACNHCEQGSKGVLPVH